MSTPVHVIVVGAGLAGLSAALELAERGLRVTVLEQRAFCGGRAYSFREPKSGAIVDNGQHVLMGCYTETLRYIDRIGARDLFDKHVRFDVLLQDAAGQPSRLNCPRLPAPLHLLAGLLRMQAFPKADVFRLLRHAQIINGMRPEQYNNYDQWSVADWLDHCGQSEAARRILWEPLTLAVMNETMERASAAPLLTMMREGLFAHDVGQGLIIPQRDLSTCLIAPALEKLEQAGVQLRNTSGVEQFIIDRDRIRGVQLRNGETLAADAIIAAVTPQALQKIVSASPGMEHPQWESLSKWQGVPILSVHLWFDQSLSLGDMIGLYDTPFHWVFNKGDGCVALVSSACRDIASWSREQTIQEAIAMMQQYFPETKDMQVKHAQLTKELQATISMERGSAARRLPTATPWSNFFLAGDWTQTYLPATIEGAVRSGAAAAHQAVTPPAL